MARTKLKKHIKCGECGEAIDAVNGRYIWDPVRQANVDLNCFAIEGSSDAVDSGDVSVNITLLLGAAATGLKHIATDYDPEHAVHMADYQRGAREMLDQAWDDLSHIERRLEESRVRQKSRK